MANRLRRLLPALAAASILLISTRASEPIRLAPGQIPPAIQREFRGAWIASYSNIDWPSRPGLPVDQLKTELAAIIEKAAQIGLNALILQVRPACDAFYRSEIEPWSYYLTGKMGEAPAEGFDPLAFAIEEAHARGMELHAWFNPYRAGRRSWDYISPDHIINRHPELVRKYAEYYWLDPAEPAVQDYTTSVILDVVRRYDVDGIHMDDYFYPYPAKTAENEIIDFPDDDAWEKYRAGGGKLDRGDWRRDNVNQLIERLHAGIKREKPWVKFGISPFGIWRPGHPEQIKGLDAYKYLFADARHWLRSGWVDYLAPQLYWPIKPPAQSYTALLNWWQDQNPKGVQIWPGGSVANIRIREWPSEEILRQIDFARQSPTPGYIHWNVTSLLRNPDGLAVKLIENQYAEPALVPATQAGPAPAKPALMVQDAPSGKLVQWAVPSSGAISLWVYQARVNGDWHTEFLPAETTSRPLETEIGGDSPEVVAVSAVNRFGTLSPTSVLLP